MSLLFNYLLSESRINRIKRLHGFEPIFSNEINEFINQGKPVMLTIYDMLKPHGGEIKMVATEGATAEFVVLIPAKHL